MLNSSEGAGSLSRLSHTSFNQSIEFTASQAMVDGGVSHFLEESANFSTFACIVAGGGASRLARTGLLAFGGNATGAAARIVQGLASFGSLSAEVAAFETTGRALQTLHLTSSSEVQNPNLWSWNGEGGLRQGFYTSFINFGAFRGAGWASQGQNIVFQHLAQSTAMVAGHNIAGALRLTHLPEGTLAQQYFEAERTNLQLASGMAFLHMAAPGLHSFERGLDLANQSRSSGRFLDSSRPLPETIEGERVVVNHESSGTLAIHHPHIVMSSTLSNKGRGYFSHGTSGPPRSTVTHWRPPRTSLAFHEYLRNLRERAGLTQEGFAEALQEKGISTRREKISSFENQSTQHRYATLRAMAEVLRTDLRDLTDVYNRTHHSDLNPQLWRTTEGLLFLSDRRDTEKMQFYQQSDPQRRSLGWFLFSERRNLAHYREAPDLAEKAGISETKWNSLELNHHSPRPETIASLARVLGVQASRIVEMINETYHPDLVPMIRRIFPGETIYIHSRSEDAEKIRYYHENPESLGRHLFLARKQQEGYLNPREMATRLGRDRRYVDEREWDRSAMTPGHLPEWIAYLRQLDLPLKILRPHLPEGVSPRSAAFELAERMAGLTVEEVSERSGLGRNTITGILHGSHERIQVRTLLGLKRAFPELNLRPFLDLIPGLKCIFPETRRKNPILRISQDQLQEALRLNLADLFPTQESGRPERNPQNPESPPSRPNGETSPPALPTSEGLLHVSYQEALMRLAGNQRIDPRSLYLRLHPEILELFPTLEGRGEKPLTIDRATRKQLRQGLPPEEELFFRIQNRARQLRPDPTTAPNPEMKSSRRENPSAKPEPRRTEDEEAVSAMGGLGRLLRDAVPQPEERKREWITLIQEGVQAEIEILNSHLPEILRLTEHSQPFPETGLDSARLRRSWNGLKRALHDYTNFRTNPLGPRKPFWESAERWIESALSSTEEIDARNGKRPTRSSEELLEPPRNEEEVRQRLERFSPLPEGRKRDLLQTVTQAVQAETDLVQSHLRYLVSVARGLGGRPGDLLDLAQEGWKGLRIGAQRFDLSRRTEKGEPIKFLTYANWWVEHLMTRYMIDNGRMVRMPVHMQERLNRLRRVITELEAQGEEATVERLAEILETDHEKVRKLIELEHSRQEHSLEAPFRGGDEGTTRSRLDLIPDPGMRPDDQVVEEGHRAALRRAFQEFAETLTHPEERRAFEQFLLDQGKLPERSRRRLQRFLTQRGLAPDLPQNIPSSGEDERSEPIRFPPRSVTPRRQAKTSTEDRPSNPVPPPSESPTPPEGPVSKALVSPPAEEPAPSPATFPKEPTPSATRRRGASRPSVPIAPPLPQIAGLPMIRPPLDSFVAPSPNLMLPSAAPSRSAVMETLKPRIAIIGFGAAGIGASHHLRQQNHLIVSHEADYFRPSLTVFEGMNRPGGKIAPNNWGAQFVDWAHFEPVSSMLIRLGLKTQRVPDYDEAPFMTHEGNTVSGPDFIEALQSLRRAATNTLRRAQSWEDWRVFDQQSAVDFVQSLYESGHFNRAQWEAMITRPGFEEGYRDEDISALSYAINLAKSYSPMPRLEVEGGLYRLAEAEMVALIASGGDVRLDTTVRRVDVLSRGVRIYFDREGAQSSEGFDFAILALSPEHLPHVEVNGSEFPLGRVSRLRPANMTKNLLLFEGEPPSEDMATTNHARWFSRQPRRAVTFFSGWNGQEPLTREQMIELAFGEGPVPTDLTTEGHSWDGRPFPGSLVPHNYTTMPQPGYGFDIVQLVIDQFFAGRYDQHPLRVAGHVMGLDIYARGGALSGEAAALSIVRGLGFTLKPQAQRNRSLSRDFFGIEIPFENGLP